ncbi:MAG: class I SAM-dependent methyltransferase [Bacteriovoracaceae bacterium]
MICPLCQSESGLFNQDKKRHYYQCRQCYFVFVDASEFISKDEEGRRYETHNNSADDPRYVDYLTNVRDSFLEMGIPGEKGVDIGSGSSTLLADLFAQKKYDVLSYDPQFHPDTNWKNSNYDFFTLSEVIEHLHHPIEVLSSLRDLLHSGGKILIKTEFIPPKEKREFNLWYYKNDDTHVHFYTESSARELSRRLGMGIEFSHSLRGVFSLVRKKSEI